MRVASLATVPHTQVGLPAITHGTHSALREGECSATPFDRVFIEVSAVVAAMGPGRAPRYSDGMN